MVICACNRICNAPIITDTAKYSQFNFATSETTTAYVERNALIVLMFEVFVIVVPHTEVQRIRRKEIWSSFYS